MSILFSTIKNVKIPAGVTAGILLFTAFHLFSTNAWSCLSRCLNWILMDSLKSNCRINKIKAVTYLDLFQMFLLPMCI